MVLQLAIEQVLISYSWYKEAWREMGVVMQGLGFGISILAMCSCVGTQQWEETTI